MQKTLSLYCMLVVAMVVSVECATAQSGDRDGERQSPPPAHLRSPPAPALAPSEALKSLRVAPGFRVELVAAEPLVFDPVAMSIDADGRMWVVEMRAYMPNVEGEGERAPIGSIAVLEDIDGDGRMDRRTEFATGLVLPRAVLPVAGGALVAEPPYLWFFEDTDADGQADRRTAIATDYGDSSNPEHAANGLLWAMDNWIYSANHTVRFRRDAAGWRREETSFRGQWGIAQDDYGRLIYNTNSDPLRMDVVPAEYLRRNPNLRDARGSNVQLATAQALPLWPSRITLGVNRGYQMLRADGTLPSFTAACAPVIYRGGLFAESFRGNAFIAEPAANLVKRVIIEDAASVPRARNAYADREFLTSSDERFRPVNMYNGPDGALYVVDMYRGVIQHRIFLTTYLRKQIKERGLEAPLGMGRIYRIVPSDTQPTAWRRLGDASVDTLVKFLSHENGWQRDTAQRLLIERSDRAALPLLRETVRRSPSAVARLHALWALEGLGAADWPVLTQALNDVDVNVATAAVRIAEPHLQVHPASVVRQLARRSARGEPTFQRQVALSLGAVRTEAASTLLMEIAIRSGGAPFMADAITSSLHGREAEFFQRMVTHRAWTQSRQQFAPVLVKLGAAILSSGDVAAIDALLAHLSSGDALSHIVLDALEHFIPGEGANRRTAFLPAAPQSLLQRAEGLDAIGMRARDLSQFLRWQGQPSDPQTVLATLTAQQRARYERGREQYAICAACHQPQGEGVDGLAPALVGSRWATGGAGALIRIVLNGKANNASAMPSMRTLDDETIASILTYIRRSWGHVSSAISPSQVRTVRGETQAREAAWTDAELEPMN